MSPELFWYSADSLIVNAAENVHRHRGRHRYPPPADALFFQPVRCIRRGRGEPHRCGINRCRVIHKGPHERVLFSAYTAATESTASGFGIVNGGGIGKGCQNNQFPVLGLSAGSEDEQYNRGCGKTLRHSMTPILAPSLGQRSAMMHVLFLSRLFR